MKRFRRKFLRILGLSYFLSLLSPHNLLYAITKKIINPNLTDKQKEIMLKEGTERPYTSPLNQEKKRRFFLLC